MKCCTANAPKLVNVITVEKIKPDATVDGSGNVDETNDANWIQCGREWAEFKTKGSREFFRNQQIGEDITHQVTIRWSRRASAYTTGMRLRMDGRKFNLSGAPLNVDEASEYLVMATIEVPAV